VIQSWPKGLEEWSTKAFREHLNISFTHDFRMEVQLATPE